jgi:signal transduction histidine kinase
MVTSSEVAIPKTAAARAAAVLIIDYERGPRESLRILLKPEFTVFCAEGVDAGVELLKEHRPDTVIMDIRMPGKSGIEGLRAIRQLDSVVSVIMYTGFGALETAQEAIRLGANDYLKKPFDAYEILNLVRRHVGRTQMERRQQNAERELVELNRTLKDEMVRKNQLAVLGQKSAELVHDLKNPLGAILGYVDLLTDELQSARERLGERWQDTSDYLENIERSVLRCRDIAEMWLEVSRGRMHRAPMELGGMIKAVAEECRHLAGQRQVELTVDVMGEEVNLEADRIQLSRAMQNLLVNAIEAVPPGTGRVHLWCGDAGPNSIELGVEDNGCGMSPDQLKRAFEPFFTTKQGTGTGLGLFIARQAVEAHGGTIRIESDTAKGTKITATLPRS